MTMLRLLDDTLLAPLQEAARASPRRRLNLNLHETMEAPCHRFFNAMEPDSYVIPHCHRQAGKEETMVVVRGSLGVLCFDDAGQIVAQHLLQASGTQFGVHIPLGCWHSVVALESDTVFLEAKAGPYVPLAADEIAPWAPREGTPQAAEYLQHLRARFA